MRIRPADPLRDGAACADVVAQCAKAAEFDPPDLHSVAAELARIARTHPWLVGERHGRVVAFAHGSRQHERAAYRWAAEVRIRVRPEFRRRGLGTALGADLLDRLVRQGIHVACAAILLPDPGAVAIHERLGFRPQGVLRAIAWSGGRWRDLGWWQRELIAPDGGPPREPRPPEGPPE